MYIIIYYTIINIDIPEVFVTAVIYKRHLLCRCTLFALSSSGWVKLETAVTIKLLYYKGTDDNMTRKCSDT